MIFLLFIVIVDGVFLFSGSSEQILKNLYSLIFSVATEICSFHLVIS